MLWIKSLHIIAVVCWFSALFYLPRLFVYHAMSADQMSKDRFKIMERKLYRGIATPSMIATIVFGFWLVYLGWNYYSTQTWFWIKLSLILPLIAYHFGCRYYMLQLRDEKPAPTHIFFRVFNELPVFILVAIVILVVVRPQF